MTGGAVEFRAAIGKTDERVATPPELSGRQGHPGFAAAIAVLLAAGVWGIATLARIWVSRPSSAWGPPRWLG